VLAASLGVATISYADAEMRLRIPALLTALILFSQALLELTPRVRRSRGGPGDGTPDVEPVPSVEPIVMTAAEVKLSRGSLPAAAGYPVPEEVQPSTAGSKRYVPYLLILLGVWLGLAVLAGDFSGWLSALSIVAAFLLFAFGWQDISGRR
jgi:hypothetical protein